jgi:hypothetical protein
MSIRGGAGNKQAYLGWLDYRISSLMINKSGYADSELYIKNLSDEEFEKEMKGKPRHVRRASIAIRRRKCTRL